MERLLIIISSPSGGGKTTVCRKLLTESYSPIFEKAEFSISATTRPKRGNELHGKDYLFLSKEEFEGKIKADDFLEHANVFGNLYGSMKSALSQTKHTIFDIDVKGHNQIKSKTKALSIFLLPPSIAILKQRVMARGDLTEKEIETRILAAPSEIAESYKYDHIIINNDLEKTFIAVCAIISSHLLKTNHRNLSKETDFNTFLSLI